MPNNISYKVFFKNYGFFVLFITILFFLLFYTARISNKFWQRNLKNNVEIVLDEKDPNCWSIGNYKSINLPITLNAACFEARNRITGELYNAVIIRVETLYGPVPAVFLIDNEKNVEFAGYSSIHGRVADQLNRQNSNMNLFYWKNKIKTFF